MSKIIVMMSVGSHQNATFFLSKKLVNEGHTVIYAGVKNGVYGEDLSGNVTRQGFRYEVFDPFKKDNDNDIDRNSSSEFHTYANNLIEGTIVKDFISNLKPDLILLDIHFPIYAIVFTCSRIPVLFISTTLLTERDVDNPPLTSSIIPRFDTSSRLEIGMIWDKIRKEIPASVRFLVTELAKKGDFILEEYLTEKCIVLFGLKLPEIILWPIEFEFSSQISFKNRVHYFGGYLSVERVEMEFDWEGIDERKKIIYCSIGTVVDSRVLIDFVAKLVEAAQGFSDYEFVISTGRLYQRVNRFSSLSNVHIYEKVPQIKVLRKSIMMITLGGANSIKECISLGVPMLCYPFHSDQFGNAARLVHHGLGIIGRIGQDSPEDIRAKIQAMLIDTGYSKRIASFKPFFKFDESEHLRLIKIIEEEMLKFSEKRGA